jgi:hypothetical protein
MTSDIGKESQSNSVRGSKMSGGRWAPRANAHIIQSLAKQRVRVPLGEIADEELRQCVVLGVTKCGRFLLAYQQFEYLTFISATWYSFSMWRINGRERATRVLSAPLFNSSMRSPFVDVSSMQITITVAADQSFVVVHGQPPNPPGSANAKRCHVTIVPTPFAVFVRARAVSERSLRVSVLHINYLVAPPFPGVVPLASIWRADESGGTLLLHCGAVIRQVKFLICTAPASDEPTVRAQPDVQPSALHQQSQPVDDACCETDEFDYPLAPSELLREYAGTGFARGEHVELWLHESADDAVDRPGSTPCLVHKYVQLEHTSLAFNVESALTSLRQRLPRLSEWTLTDYDARALIVEDDELLVLCCAVYCPRRRLGGRECLLVAVLGVDDVRCRVVQLLELANLDSPLVQFALNRMALKLSIELRAKFAVRRNAFACVTSVCNASVFRGSSLSAITSSGVPLAITI